MMTVQEMIEKHFSMANKNLGYMVKPIGTLPPYYRGDGTIIYMCPIIRKMEVRNWLIDFKNNLVVMIVERDAEFEKEREDFWKERRSNV